MYSPAGGRCCDLVWGGGGVTWSRREGREGGVVTWPWGRGREGGVVTWSRGWGREVL